MGARRGGVLVPLLVLPLYVPVLIFAVSAIDAAAGRAAGLGPTSCCWPPLLALALPLTPMAAAAALRQALT